jgi:hypothetical protein
MMMKINFQSFLDLLATVFGTISGVAQLLVVTNRISQDDGLLISGLATIALGIVANKGRLPRTGPNNPPHYFPYEFAPYDSPPYNDPYYEPPTEKLPKAHQSPYQTLSETQYNSPIKPTIESTVSSQSENSESTIKQSRFKRRPGRRLKNLESKSNNSH